MSWPITNPIARELDEFWQESQALQQSWWVEADLDIKMVTGQQDVWNQFYNINYRNQKQLIFNKMLRIHNMIGGFQRDHRLASIIQAADNDPDMGETADQRTVVLADCMRKDNTYHKISDTFEGSNACGLNLLELWMDFREDPENGQIRTQRIPFNAFLTDNFWNDWSENNRVWTRKYITKRQLLSLMPKIEKDMPYLGKGYAAKDGKFQFLQQNWYQYNQEMYAYDQYWTRDYRVGRKLLDKATGEVADWKGTREQFAMLKRINPNVEMVSAQIPTIKLHVLVNNQLVYEEKSPYGLDRFPHVPSICYQFSECQDYRWRFFGIPRNIRDSQVELNRRRNSLLDILDAQTQSGIITKEDALVNPEDAFIRGPGKVYFLKQSAQMTDIQAIPAPPVAAGWLELIQSIEKEIMDIVGPEELFAQNMGAKEMTGVLMKLKMGAGLTGLRSIFDRLNWFQSEVCSIMDDMAINNFSEGKVAHILGHKPTEHFFDTTFNKFNCVVEEAELTSSQRQLQFLQAVQMKQIMPDAIDDDYLLDKSTLVGKKELIERSKAKQQQAQQMQQQQAQAEMRQAEVLARSLEAKAMSDYAGAEEKMTKSVTNMATAKDQSAKAAHEEASAVLENARAAYVLDELDENRLYKLADFVMQLQERQKGMDQAEEAHSQAMATEVGASAKQSEAQSKPAPAGQQ